MKRRYRVGIIAIIIVMVVLALTRRVAKDEPKALPQQQPSPSAPAAPPSAAPPSDKLKVRLSPPSLPPGQDKPVPVASPVSPSAATSGPGKPAMNPARPAAPAEPPPAPAANDAEARAAAASDVDKIGLMLRDFRTLMGSNPVGTNAEIMKAVMGGNARQAMLGPPEGQHLNASGELVDRWGTPYFFHQLSATNMQIRSAGPDLRMWTEDDVVYP